MPSEKSSSRITRFRERLAWAIHPHTSERELFDEHLKVQFAIMDAEREIGLRSDEYEHVAKIDKAHRKFSRKLGGHFERPQSLADVALVTIVGGMVLKVLQSVQEPDDRD